jgi:hypothetical protein
MQTRLVHDKHGTSLAREELEIHLERSFLEVLFLASRQSGQ